jgi:hypothetical protein
MHPRLQEIDEFLTMRRQEVLTAVGSVHDADHRVVPAGTWSVASVIDHLRLTETGVSKLVHVTVSRLPADARVPETETDSVLHRVDHGKLADRDQRRPAPAIVQPRTDLTLAEALAGLEASRAALRNSLQEADGIALGQFNYPHPMFGALDLYQWLVFLGLHESRHACQIRELGETRFDP